MVELVFVICGLVGFDFCAVAHSEAFSLECGFSMKRGTDVDKGLVTLGIMPRLRVAHRMKAIMIDLCRGR